MTQRVGAGGHVGLGSRANGGARLAVSGRMQTALVAAVQFASWGVDQRRGTYTCSSRQRTLDAGVVRRGARRRGASVALAERGVESPRYHPCRCIHAGGRTQRYRR